jgi:putative endonuclease
MYYVYILYSPGKDRYYIGQTQDVEIRLQQHCINRNLGIDDWVLRYTEKYITRSEAVKREKEIKNKKRRAYLEMLISSAD